MVNQNTVLVKIATENKDGEGYEYTFYVELIKPSNDILHDGKYIPIRHGGLNGRPLVQISPGHQVMKIIRHEALHACIDFFRIDQRVSFDDLFGIDSALGEEAFACYLVSFEEAILDGVSRIEYEE